MIVRDMYVILVSIVASKSTFNMDGRMVSKRHNKLHPSTLKALNLVGE